MAQTKEANNSFLYGWWIVFVAAIGLFMGYGPIVTFTFSVFLRLLNQEFGWSRGEISQAFSLSLLVMSLAFPVIGRLVDRFGARKVIIPSILLFGLALMSLSWLSGNLWHLYAVYILLGLVGGGTAPVPYSNVLSHWFDKRRGLALGIAMVGLGLGAFVMPSLAQMLIVSQGWRQAYILIGAMVMVVTIPMVGLFLKETPEMVGLRPDGEAINTDPSKRKQTESWIERTRSMADTHVLDLNRCVLSHVGKCTWLLDSPRSTPDRSWDFSTTCSRRNLTIWRSVVTWTGRCRISA